MDIIVSTGNKGKLKEFRDMMEFADTTVHSLYEVMDNVPEIVEDGDTFKMNAIKKVAFLPHKANTLYLADDSGLSVHALNGAPGVKSARFGGPTATNEDRCFKILYDLKHALEKRGKDPEDPDHRTAHFTSVIALKYQNGLIQTFEGVCYGHITTAPRGNDGFGYDPIFIPEGHTQTFAEMDKTQKNQLSHRFKAMLKLAKELQRIPSNPQV